MTAVLLGDTYDYWKACKDKGTYEVEKQKLAERVIDFLSEKLPKIKEKVAVVGVATPLTYERYCGTYRGGWIIVHQGATK